MEYAKMELDAANKGWRCSNCGLFVDCIGRPLFGKEAWAITTKSINWLENRPPFRFCPKCGLPIRDGDRHA